MNGSSLFLVQRKLMRSCGEARSFLKIHDAILTFAQAV
jgi:hypothetical protein